MQILLLLISAAVSGIFAGMGMGGGTFLIPILRLFFSVEQILCQSTNVICFVLVSVCCFFIYLKNKLIDFKVLLLVAPPATILAIFSSLFALKIKSEILQICFSGFIILVGIFCFVKAVIAMKKKRK